MSTKQNGKRDSNFIAISCGVLGVALVIALSMLFRARGIHAEVSAEEANAQLFERRADLRARVAEMTSLKMVTLLPRSQTDLSHFQSSLEATARRFAKDPLDGNANAGPFACEALEFTAGDGEITVWTSGIIDEGDRAWALNSISAQLKDGTEGSRIVMEETRVVGASWAAFQVDGKVRVGALVWLTPRYHVFAARDR